MIPDSAENSLHEARASFLSGRLDYSYRALKRLEHLGHKSFLSDLLLSQIYIRKDALQHAQLYANRAKEDDRYEADSIATRVELSLKQGNIAEAKQIFSLYETSNGSSKVLKELLESRINLFEGQYELALYNISLISASNRDLQLAREAFRVGFAMFRDCGEPLRYQSFLDSVGLSLGKADKSHSQTQSPDQGSIDIILPIHNNLADLKACLNSLEQWRESCQGKLILIDDCSSEATHSFLRAYVSDNSNSILLRNASNLGFTRSVQKGVAASDSPYFVLLNSDTLVTPGWLSGLWQALASDSEASLAGPFSNNAFCQSLLPPNFDWTAECNHNLTVERLASVVTAYSKKCYPRIPFLSGFCLLMERGAYENSGGLDAENYPFGYWEVQDLSLRLLDMGRYGVLADNVYVHHRSGGSSAAPKRSRLIADGLRRLANTHGEIRVLSAEEATQSNDTVQDMVTLVNKYVKDLQRIGKKVNIAKRARPLIGQARRVWTLRKSLNYARKDVCIFAAYTPDGIISPITQDYLQALSENGFQIVISLACRDIDIVISPEWLKHADAVLVRENFGFDFGSWADVLRDCPGLWHADRLLFANDSVIPITSLRGALQNVRQSQAGFFSMTDCHIGGYHAQSYFFGWRTPNLHSAALKKFWGSVNYCAEKTEAITLYEKEIFKLSKNLPDGSTHILFPVVEIFGQLGAYLENFSITHTGWRALLESGCPLVKSRLLLEGDKVISELAERSTVPLETLLLHAETLKIDRT